jgi:hypothetical protein
MTETPAGIKDRKSQTTGGFQRNVTEYQAKAGSIGINYGIKMS